MTTKTKPQNAFAVSMFDAIKSSLKGKDSSNANANFRDILRFEVGNTYLVRLLPNKKNPEKTFYHYFNHGWVSTATGKFMSVLCPQTYGETCPIDQERFKVWRDGTDQQKESVRPLKRRENWMVNVLVISDPTNSENEGKVKILRYGSQLNKIIDAAINGDDAKEYGAKIFDLSENGCTFRIKAESISENTRNWTTYTSSRFLPASEIPGMTEEKITEIDNSLHDLESMEERKSYAELKEMLSTHFYGNVEVDEEETPAPAATVVDEDDDDKIDLTPVGEEHEEVSETPTPAKAEDDQKLDDLLKDL